MAFYVYILAGNRNGTLYVGMTDDLPKRIWQHRSDLLPGFTQRYSVKMLVWYEPHESRESAFARERQIKKWTGLEAGIDRANKSGLARFVRRPESMKQELDSRFRGNERRLLRSCHNTALVPAFAGTNGGLDRSKTNYTTTVSRFTARVTPV